jgi:hypothetical protein
MNTSLSTQPLHFSGFKKIPLTPQQANALMDPGFGLHKLEVVNLVPDFDELENALPYLSGVGGDHLYVFHDDHTGNHGTEWKTVRNKSSRARHEFVEKLDTTA